ncbi:MAG: ABC transporter ATP-binding protein [Candidatus Moraniibacteriota bacterium]|nr:MAG: ABC transporter ATP-binding protein [Candidatus Moranbacteria bacterium]
MATKREPPVRFSAYIVEMKETWYVLKWVWQELIGAEGKKWALWMSLATVLMMSLFTLQPLVFSWMVNAIRDERLQALGTAGAALISAAICHHSVSTIQALCREYAWNRSMHHLQGRINQLFCEKSLGQHSAEGSNLNFTSLDRAKGRVETVQQMLLFETSSIISGLLLSYVLLWTLGWQIGLVATALVIVHVLWSLYLNYHVSKTTAPIEKEFRAYGRQLNERWEKITRVKTSGKTRSEHLRLEQWFNRILLDDKKFWFWFIRQAAKRDTVALLVRFGVIVYGAMLVYDGVWQIGALIPLYTWMTAVTENLWYIGHAERRLNQQVPYIKSMRTALSMTPDFLEDAGEHLTHTEPIRVRFDNVGLSYSDTPERWYPILRGISFAIEPGEKVALIGSSGAGKTSIMKLLLRYMDPTSGEIRINGSALKDVALSTWMERVGYIPQQPQVFDGTIRYNLTFGLSAERQASITDEEIWQVMRELQIDFGERLTLGLDTLVGKDGVKLSGGQAQRLMIGAAVIKQPIFMVIDEATSSLDSSTERLVQQGLERVLAGPVGAIIVAHRLSTVRTICNRFIVLRPLEEVGPDDSQIEAEANSFEELYGLSPTFRRLADDQHLSI